MYCPFIIWRLTPCIFVCMLCMALWCELFLASHYNFAVQVEPNAQRLEEHRRKYERLRKEKEDKKIEREKQRRRAQAQVVILCLFPKLSFYLLIM